MTNKKVQEMIELSLTMKEVENSHDQCIYCWHVDCNCDSKVTVEEDLFLNFNDEL
jgi:hypothetical protein